MRNGAAPRVLIVEDDYYLATDAQTILEGAGYAVVGPCPDAATSVELIEREEVDCALVDINLGQGPSFEVARALQARQIPFVFVTGYDAPVIPQEFAEVKRLEKPFVDRNLVAMVKTLG